jgi:hypothetical protein
MDHPFDAAMHCVAAVTNAPRLTLVAAALLWLLVRAPLIFPKSNATPGDSTATSGCTWFCVRSMLPWFAAECR